MNRHRIGSLFVLLLLVAPAGAQADASVSWAFNLPGSFAPLAGGGYATGFESGALSAEMASTAVDAATWLPDPKAWSTIGTGVFSVVPYEGSYEYELGFDPSSAMGWHDVNTALVIGLDGAGHAGPFLLECRYYDWGESNQAIDGVWMSDDGANWFQMQGTDGDGNSGFGWADWSDGSSQWGALSFDLAAEAALHGVDLDGAFYVAFGEETGLPLGFFGGIHLDAIQVDAQPWTDLGDALAGTYGDPLLAGSGPLLGNEPVTLTLTNALENATTGLVIGLSVVNAPFKGGVLVPDTDLILLFATDGGGSLVLPATWPPGVPPASTFAFQAWIQDPAGPAGYAASNGLSGATPP
ncbi:MAG: hypothetical protein ACYTG2_19185 [Planctomycetota bacterium]